MKSKYIFLSIPIVLILSLALSTPIEIALHDTYLVFELLNIGILVSFVLLTIGIFIY